MKSLLNERFKRLNTGTLSDRACIAHRPHRVCKLRPTTTVVSMIFVLLDHNSLWVQLFPDGILFFNQKDFQNIAPHTQGYIN